MHRMMRFSVEVNWRTYLALAITTDDQGYSVCYALWLLTHCIFGLISMNQSQRLDCLDHAVIMILMGNCRHCRCAGKLNTEQWTYQQTKIRFEAGTNERKCKPFDLFAFIDRTCHSQSVRWPAKYRQLTFHCVHAHNAFTIRHVVHFYEHFIYEVERTSYLLGRPIIKTELLNCMLAQRNESTQLSW